MAERRGHRPEDADMVSQPSAIITGTLGAPAFRRVALDLFDRMGKRWKDHGKILAHGPGAAGEVRDQGLFPDADDGSGNHGTWRLFEALGAHGLRHAWKLAVNHRKRGFGRHITGGYARTSSRDDEIDVS